MLKRMVSALLLLAILAVVPTIVGCQKPSEFKSHSESSTTSSDTHEKVE